MLPPDTISRKCNARYISSTATEQQSINIKHQQAIAYWCFLFGGLNVTILKFSKIVRENLREIFVGVLIILISASMIGAFNVTTSAIGWLRSIDRNTFQTSQKLEAMMDRLDNVETDISILKTKVK